MADSPPFCVEKGMSTAAGLAESQHSVDLPHIAFKRSVGFESSVDFESSVNFESSVVFQYPVQI